MPKIFSYSINLNLVLINNQEKKMKKTTILPLLFIASLNAFAGAFSTDVAIKTNLSIHLKDKKELSLDNSGSTKLLPTFTEVEFDYRPTFGSGDLIIKQGPKTIKVKVPKDRYHNQGEFTLYSVDSGLVHDIYMRRSEDKVINSTTVTEDSSCMYQKFKSVGANGIITYEGHPGTQKVLRRYDKISRTYTMSLIRDRVIEASIKQTIERTESELLKEISNCSPNDYSILLKN